MYIYVCVCVCIYVCLCVCVFFFKIFCRFLNGCALPFGWLMQGTSGASCPQDRGVRGAVYAQCCGNSIEPRHERDDDIPAHGCWHR